MMKPKKSTELHKQSRLHPISAEIDELAALARMTLYLAEQLVSLSPRSTHVAFDLLKSIETDLRISYGRSQRVRKKLN